MMTRFFEDETAEFVWAWGITPPDLGKSRGEQAYEIFGEIERLLAEREMTFANVVRTWFYNDDINGWYAEFNSARTRFFESRRVFETFLPASTGIGHGNPFGAALVAGVFAMKAKGASAGAEVVKSPLQTDAMTYRSSFSRAAETHSASGRRLFVSGTASILPDSCEVAHVGNPKRQISCAMRAALAIVESRGMSVADVSRAIVYLKRPEYRKLWREWLDEKGLPVDFATVLDAEVCRPEWLFEVEMDAVKNDKVPYEEEMPNSSCRV